MLRPILKYGDQALHEPARAVEAFTPEVDRLIGDMIETMYAAPGIGLAAPQVGAALRIFVVDLSLGRDPSALIVMVNPQFVERDGMQLEDEGCLSVPGFNATVVRQRIRGFQQGVYSLVKFPPRASQIAFEVKLPSGIKVAIRPA